MWEAFTLLSPLVTYAGESSFLTIGWQTMCKSQSQVCVSPRSTFRALGIGVVAGVLGLLSVPAMADNSACGFKLDSRFVESAPRDSFVFSHQSGKNWNIVSIQVDMGESAGRLIFDTTDAGQGVEVFQPFAVAKVSGASGEAVLRNLPTPSDGDQGVTLDFSTFPKDSRFAFTIDVDDQLADSELGQIRVSGSEIAGSVLSVTAETPEGESTTLQGSYDSQGRVSIAGGRC